MSTKIVEQPIAIGNRITRIISKLGLFLVIILFVIVMSILSPVFFSLANFRNLLIQSTILAVLALGETFVIMTGGIDLSIGGVMGVSSAIGLGLMVFNGVPVFIGILVSLAIGVAIGYINGVSVTRIGITPLIVTLSTLGIARGIVFVYTNGANITPVPSFFVILGSGSLVGIPISVFLLVLLAVITHMILARTVFGRSVYAAGGNELAARLSGIRTQRVIILTYIISATMAAIAGILLTARLESAGPRAGIGVELTVIAAVVIGGTSLYGGQGSIVGTILGVILISLVTNAVNLLGVPPAWDELVKGLVIYIAAFVDVYRRKMTTGARQYRRVIKKGGEEKKTTGARQYRRVIKKGGEEKKTSINTP